MEVCITKIVHLVIKVKLQKYTCKIQNMVLAITLETSFMRTHSVNLFNHFLCRGILSKIITNYLMFQQNNKPKRVYIYVNI